jgi:hypothetical protein
VWDLHPRIPAWKAGPLLLWPTTQIGRTSRQGVFLGLIYGKHEVTLSSLPESGAVDRIRTCGLIVGNDALYLAELLLRESGARTGIRTRVSALRGQRTDSYSMRAIAGRILRKLFGRG